MDTHSLNFVRRAGWLAVGAAVAQWVAVAAILDTPLPAATNTVSNRGRSEHWSLQPLQRVPVPAIPTAQSGVRNPIDHFIIAKLGEHGLNLSPEADRATLIRRLSFDLLGLPPTPREIDEFVQDPSLGADDALVERLLASPRYGERWGRHWLDVARYTESQGFEYDRLRDNAWHYRDYVIQSFNEDKPYDHFVREQIAGDVLEPVTREGIIGTSLLVCGPWDEAGNSQANVTQRRITREEEMEDLISVVGQTFLGLTVNCARCHSHKFDPIPHQDYYRIKSVFEGVKHGERIVAPPSEVQAREALVARFKSESAGLAAAVARIESEGSKAAAKRRFASRGSEPGPAALVRWTFDGATNAGMLGELKGGATIADGRLKLTKEGAFFQTAPLSRDLREKTLEAWVALAYLTQRGGAAISIESASGDVFDAIVFGEREPGKWVAGSNGFQRTKDLEAAAENATPGELVHMAIVYHADNRIAIFRNGVPYGRPYAVGSPLPTFKAGDAHVLLGLRHKGGGRPFLTGEITQAALYDRALSDAEVAAAYRSAGAGVTRDEMLAHLSAEQGSQRAEALLRIERIRSELNSLRPLPVSYAGTRQQPEPTHRLQRGDVNSPEEVVTPGALSALVDLNPDFGLRADAPEAQRRLKFADWLADPRNPLPARVMVNRIWHLHFGQGLVATPNDFGASGARPSHPELLDWLAARFIADGWSVKRLHRLIVNSATYRQLSRFDERSAARDADNQWLWRFPPRRLEAELLRDAMLAASGQLNVQAGGPSYRPFEILKFPANAYLPVDRESPEFNRRTVYRMNVNSGKEPLLDAFDCPDPSVKTPRRGVTTTPLQALGLMNNAFVLRQADRLAERALKEAGGDAVKAIQTAYRYVLGRPATAAESERAVDVVETRGLANVCWVLLNATEFIYVR